MSLRRAGWTANGPTTWHDQNGVAILLGEHSPKMIASKLQQAMQVRREQAAAANLGQEHFGGRICADVPKALCRCKKTDSWSRFLIKAAGVGGLGTRDRSLAAGYDT